VPGLPGCDSQGETLAEALANIREATELWLDVTAETAVKQSQDAKISAELQEIEL
jgi:predicted RNase H-like HicB family nuclease